MSQMMLVHLHGGANGEIKMLLISHKASRLQNTLAPHSDQHRFSYSCSGIIFVYISIIS